MTETIDEIIALTQAIIDRGHGYEAGGDVYFRVRSDERYGELSRRDLDDADQGEGLEGADRKEDPADFRALKATKPARTRAGTRRGARVARPGTSSARRWGEAPRREFEIHGGGRDLVFPHHENEEAQTRCGTGHTWPASGCTRHAPSRREKMSKSLGNVALLSDVLDRWGADAVLYLFATAHYRQPLAFSDVSLEQGAGPHRPPARDRRVLIEGPSPAELSPHRDAFFDALADDFNTTVALAALAEWCAARTAARVARSATPTCARCSRSSGSTTSCTPTRPRMVRARRSRRWWRPARLHAPRRTGLLRTPRATAAAALGWVVRDGPTARS